MAPSSFVLTETETETHRVAAPGRVITELTRGREMADRLRLMLREADSVVPAQSLVTQLLDTFTQSLTMLRDSDGVSVSQVPSAAKSEGSGDSCKTPPPAKDRRGCYKRKRNAETVIKESPNMVEDGHAWRKYGQKVILNAKHPRNYFRCTHKYEQGCEASKHVQRVQDNPPLYRFTYNGHHTCNSSTSTSTPSSQLIWAFNSTSTAADDDFEYYSSIDHIKREAVEMKSPSSSSSHSHYYMASSFTHHRHRLSFSSSDDVYSCTATATTHEDDHSNNIDIDDDISIDDFFQF